MEEGYGLQVGGISGRCGEPQVRPAPSAVRASKEPGTEKPGSRLRTTPSGIHRLRVKGVSGCQQRAELLRSRARLLRVTGLLVSHPPPPHPSPCCVISWKTPYAQPPPLPENPQNSHPCSPGNTRLLPLSSNSPTLNKCPLRSDDGKFQMPL